MVRLVKLVPSKNPEKKYDAVIEREGREKTISFGQKTANDFTTAGDTQRKQRYIARHAARENWGFSGIDTPGFWSRWYLWEKENKEDALNNIFRKFPQLTR